MNLREAVSAFVKAIRAARRYPIGSPIRESSALELSNAVRKALVHGPFVVRLGPDGPVLPGDPPAPLRLPDHAPIDLVLRDSDLDALRDIVDRWATESTRIDARGADSA